MISYVFQIISRTKTPAEIIAEYERLQREKEERRLQQRTNPRVCVTLFLNLVTDLRYIGQQSVLWLRLQHVLLLLFFFFFWSVEARTHKTLRVISVHMGGMYHTVIQSSSEIFVFFLFFVCLLPLHWDVCVCVWQKCSTTCTLLFHTFFFCHRDHVPEVDDDILFTFIFTTIYFSHSYLPWYTFHIYIYHCKATAVFLSALKLFLFANAGHCQCWNRCHRSVWWLWAGWWWLLWVSCVPVTQNWERHWLYRLTETVILILLVLLLLTCTIDKVPFLTWACSAL